MTEYSLKPAFVGQPGWQTLRALWYQNPASGTHFSSLRRALRKVHLRNGLVQLKTSSIVEDPCDQSATSIVSRSSDQARRARILIVYAACLTLMEHKPEERSDSRWKKGTAPTQERPRTAHGSSLQRCMVLAFWLWSARQMTCRRQCLQKRCVRQRCFGHRLHAIGHEP